MNIFFNLNLEISTRSQCHEKHSKTENKNLNLTDKNALFEKNLISAV